ncbi:MAG: hypothetical protein WBN04_01690 [Paracoccaceae bacterium]
MKILFILTAFVLAATPTLARGNCGDHAERTTSSCIDGFVWDTTAQACVEKTTS